MTKSTVTRLYVGGLVAVFAGAAACVGAIWFAFASNVFIMSGPDVTGINSTPFAWLVLAIAALGCIVAFGGAIAMFVAWIGALLNTAQLDSKVWFIVLLVVGLTCLGFIPMLAYVVGGPDGTSPTPQFLPQPA